MKKTAPARRADPPSDLSYEGYLHLPELLSIQKPLSKPESADEMQFIVVHQTFELWFRLMLHEIDAAFRHLAADRTLEAERLFRRLRAIVRAFFPALEVIETMVPSDFLKFRDLLKPASGFQSAQFRELEFACGLKDDRYVRLFDGDPQAVRRLRARLDGPTLWDAFAAHLARRGFAAATEAQQRAAIVAIYRDEKQYELRALSEAMIQFDEDFALYRQHHVKMAERMIGSKAGTGEKVATYALGQTGPMGTHGVEYLRSTLAKTFFPVLWDARTEM